MGCWDIFCFACGNTCHSMHSDYVQDIKELYTEYINSKSKKKSYYTKLFDQISSNPNFFVKLKALHKSSQWLNKCTFLTVDDRIIHGCEEVACNIDFSDGKGNIYSQDLNTGIIDELTTNLGIFIHTDCWKYIKSQYGINLKYSDVPVIKEKKQYYKINSKINYGLIEKYWEQDFNFMQVVLDSNQYMCESPLKNKANCTRIKKILSQLKLNTDKKRTGPSVSATFYPESTFKVGIDNEIWEKKSGRWVKISEPIKTLTGEISLDDIPRKMYKMASIGEPSEQPIFILSMEQKKSNKYLINLIGSVNQIDIIKKLFN